MPAVVTSRSLSKRYRLGSGVGSSSQHTLGEMVYDQVGRLFRRRHESRSIRREPFWALQDVNFEVSRGEVLGVIGRNGAGKSTLLKVLASITRPTTGEVEMRGRVGSLLEVGTGFHPELSGRENIFLSAAVLGMSRREVKRKFNEIVEFAGVEKFLDTPVKRYSSGMYVRLAFGVAAHLEPEILLIDEVLAVGDAGLPAALPGPDERHRPRRADRSCSCRTTWARSSTSVRPGGGDGPREGGHASSGPTAAVARYLELVSEWRERALGVRRSRGPLRDRHLVRDLRTSTVNGRPTSGRTPRPAR